MATACRPSGRGKPTICVRICVESSSLAFDERSEEHTSELQSQSNLVCRLLLEKKKENRKTSPPRRATSDPRRSHRAPCPRSLYPEQFRRSNPLSTLRPQRRLSSARRDRALHHP